MDNYRRKFNVLYVGQGVSILTSSIIQMVFIWYIIDKTKSAAALSLATIVGYLPQIIIGYFAGTVVDRFKKKYIMIISDLFIAFVTLLLFIYGLWAPIPLTLIYGVLFLRSIGTAFHMPSLQAFIPLFVPKNQLKRYVGYAKGFESFSDLVSPAIAAILYSLFPFDQIVIIGVFGLVFAVLMLLLVKVDEKIKVSQNYQYFDEIKKGLIYTKNHPHIRILIVIGSMYALIYAPIGTMFPLIALEHFKVGVKGSAIVETVLSIGTLLGSIILGVFANKIRNKIGMAASIGVYGLCLIIIGLIPTNMPLIFYGAAFVMGLAIPFYGGIQLAIIQSTVTPVYMGRVISLVYSFSRLSMPIGLSLASIFVERVGIGQWYTISGIIVIGIALFTLLNKNFA